MLRKRLLAVTLLLCCLVSVAIPKGLAAGSLTAPTVTLPSGWSLVSQTAYPNFYTGAHDSQGCGAISYNGSVTYVLFKNSTVEVSGADAVYIFYENSMGISYSNAQLQAEAETIAPAPNLYYQYSKTPFNSYGVTTYAGVPAGYATAYNTTYGYYLLHVIMIMGNYYLDILSSYVNPTGQAEVNSIINSISVPAPTPTPTPASTPTASLSPTATPLPTSTTTASPSSNPTPTVSPAPTPTSTASTSTPQATSSPSGLSSPTVSPSSAPTSTPSSSSLPLPSQEASNFTTSVWVPPPQNAATATVVSVTAVGAASIVFAAAGAGAATASEAATSASAGSAGGKVTKKISDLVPDTLKKWLQDFVSSKRKLSVTKKTGSPFRPTKPEALAYIISTLFLAFSFSYVKVNTLSQILIVLPTILATSILVGFAKTFVSIVWSRRLGVWTEHKIWYFGLATFIVTTFAFRMPFSSPTRDVHYGPKFTKRLGAILSSASILMSLAFAGFFGILLLAGFTVMGSTGLAMCIIGAFFDTFPIDPMSGKDILNHSKTLWIGLFTVTLALYASWLLLM